MIIEDGDGFLHSEVGIDKDLERLLAEDPGLYMEEVTNSETKSYIDSNKLQDANTSHFIALNTLPSSKRCVLLLTFKKTYVKEFLILVTVCIRLLLIL